MGAGDSFFAAFLVCFLRMSERGNFYSGDMKEKLTASMRAGAEFAVSCCGMEGAFGYGIPIPREIIMKLDIYENIAEGIKCVYKNDKWLVSIKNWKPDNDISGIARLEIHHSTDEQFILVQGRAMLIVANREKDRFDIDVVPMEIGKVYNVPKERWFYSITQHDTKMVYVQDSNCSMENSDFCNLSKEEIAFIQQKAKEYFHNQG
jgi:mannose-6-phosphate isomerase-like protein (cupin superfamily)